MSLLQGPGISKYREGKRGGNEAAERERESVAGRKGHQLWSQQEWVLITSSMSKFLYLSKPQFAPL